MDRFSKLYLERGQPTRDSERFRNRLSAYFRDNLHDVEYRCRLLYESETGAKVPWVGGGWDFSAVFEQAELRDVLDAVTITFRTLLGERRDRFAISWRDFVGRAMREENVGYRVDEQCVVHYHVDQEFERNRAATVTALEAPQLGAVRAAFEDAYRHLDATPSDTKAAARSMFESLEIMAKLILPGADRLTRNLCVQKLKDACLATVSDETERSVLSNLFTSLGYWVEAVHDYRHGQRGHEPIAPSEETAVLILSSGTAYLRALAAMALKIQTGRA